MAVETRVVYFPADSKIKVKSANDLEHAHEICAELEAYAPMIEQRTVTITDWVVVENPTYEALESGP